MVITVRQTTIERSHAICPETLKAYEKTDRLIAGRVDGQSIMPHPAGMRDQVAAGDTTVDAGGEIGGALAPAVVTVQDLMQE